MMLTVDVEFDYAWRGDRSIKTVIPQLLDFFNEYKIKATFFIVANLVENHLKIIKKISEKHEIACHSYTHQILSRLSPREIAFEVIESKRLFEKFGFKIYGFRAPFFITPKNWVKYLEKAEYLYDSSFGCVYPSRLNHLSPWVISPNKGIVEIPTSSFKDNMTPFGLTYLRLYHPLSKYMFSNKANLFFLHPHEFLGDISVKEIPSIWHLLLRRNTGKRAWKILKETFTSLNCEFISCREFTETFAKRKYSLSCQK